MEDLRVLEKDEGLGRVLSRAETQGMRQRERRALPRRWRGASAECAVVLSGVPISV